MKFPKYLITFILALVAGFSLVLNAQDKDSLVVLLSSKSAQMVDVKGAS